MYCGTIINDIYFKIILEDVERRRNEYIGETRRLERLLRELGVEDRSITGPSSAYLQVWLAHAPLSVQTKTNTTYMKLSFNLIDISIFLKINQFKSRLWREAAHLDFITFTW